MTQVPLPAPENFDEAAQVFNQRKPAGTRIAGIAIVISTTLLWSVNYEVDDEDKFPAPRGENRDKARSKLQSVQPTNAALVQCLVCQIKPGGLVLSKWQVTYSVRITAGAHPRNETRRDIEKQAAKASPKSQDRIKSDAPPLYEAYQKHAAQWFKAEEDKRTHLFNKMRNVYITPKNVNRFTISEVKTWFTKAKRNSFFALKRQVKKVTGQQPIKTSPVAVKPFVKSETLIATQPKPKADTTDVVIDPKRIYQKIAQQTMIKKISDLSGNMKMPAIASLYHLTCCAKPGSSDCTKAALVLRQTDLIKDVEELKKALPLILKAYQLKPAGLHHLPISTTIPDGELFRYHTAGQSLCR